MVSSHASSFSQLEMSGETGNENPDQVGGSLGSGLTLSGIALPPNSPFHGIALPAVGNGKVNG
jgi:hypothetical protein